MRIALFSGNYNCVRDGANKALNRLVAFLLNEGAAVRIYSPTVARPAFQPAGHVVSVPSVGIPGRSEYRLALGLTRSIREDISRFQPTHFHLSAPDLLGRSAQRLARKLGLPVITSLHTRFEAYLEYYGLRFLVPAAERHLRSFYAASDCVLAPNELIAEELRDKGLGGSVRVWGRGVDQELFSPGRRDLEWRRAQGYADDEVVVMFFGRLVLEKGLAVFEQTVRELHERGHAIRPLIVGDGPAREWLAARLPDPVFTGHLEGAALARAVASADILVNPSVTEAFGNVNLEAMAAGVAVVSADVDSARALIEPDESGLLVSPRSPSAYAEMVDQLIASPERRSGLAMAGAAAAATYSWPNILEPVLDIYRNSPF
ncbi:MAG TPA: glycosyltransferase family 1 protein [Allosphingosinicella sp.]|nr:glycosyltransferase family 1 protein [Allosphingosinicella sp.]